MRLFRLFRKEQTDPESFYAGLAEDTVSQLEDYGDLHGRTVVDVGGGPGHFTDGAAGPRRPLLPVRARLGRDAQPRRGTVRAP